MYENGKQYSWKENLWEVIKTAACNIKIETVEKKLDERLMMIIKF